MVRNNTSSSTVVSRKEVTDVRRARREGFEYLSGVQRGAKVRVDGKFHVVKRVNATRDVSTIVPRVDVQIVFSDNAELEISELDRVMKPVPEYEFRYRGSTAVWERPERVGVHRGDTVVSFPLTEAASEPDVDVSVLRDRRVLRATETKSGDVLLSGDTIRAKEIIKSLRFYKWEPRLEMWRVNKHELVELEAQLVKRGFTCNFGKVDY